MASTLIIDHSWDMMDMSVVSRADLHICMVMFMENVRLGYEKYKGSGTTEIDYEALNAEMMELTPDERAEQAIMLMYIFAADHSKLIAAFADEDQETFEQIISDDMLRLFPEYVDAAVDTKLNEDLPESSSTFSASIDSEESASAVEALEAEIMEALDEDGESETFAQYLDENSELDDYLGSYDLTCEADTLTLASPVKVTNEDASGAIVLCYNEETDEWEEASDVQIVDSYVYAVFTSSEETTVAVYTTSYKGEARVTVDGTMTCYDTLAEAVAAAKEASATSDDITITLNSDVSISESIVISNEFTTAVSYMYFDLNGKTISADVDSDYAITVTSDAAKGYVIIQNGAIDTTDATYGTINAITPVKIINMSLTNSNKPNVIIEGSTSSSYIQGCTIVSYNGCCVKNTAGSGTKSMYISGDDNYFYVVSSDEEEYEFTEENACLYAAAGRVTYIAGPVNFTSKGTGITSDGSGSYVSFSTSSGSIGGDIAAIYMTDSCTKDTNISSNCTIQFGGPLVTNSSKADYSINGGSYSVEPDASYINNGYGTDYNDDTLYYDVVALNMVEITDSEGNVYYTNLLNASAVTTAAGGSLKLLGDVNISTVFNITKDVTIDLGGFTATSTISNSFYMIRVYNGATVTIKNGTITKSGTMTQNIAVCAYKATLNLENVAVYCTAPEGTNSFAIVVGDTSTSADTVVNITGSDSVISGPTAIFVQNKAGSTYTSTLVIDGATIVGTENYAIAGNGNYDGTAISINNASITGVSCGIYHPQNGDLDIANTTITAGVGIQICDGNLDISGDDTLVIGTGDDTHLEKTGDGCIDDASAISIVNRSGYSSTYPTAVISGGSYKSLNGKSVEAYAWANDTMSDWDATGYVTISGGKFYPTVANYISTGYEISSEVDENGYYTVSIATEEEVEETTEE